MAHSNCIVVVSRSYPVRQPPLFVPVTSDQSRLPDGKRACLIPVKPICVEKVLYQQMSLVRRLYTDKLFQISGYLFCAKINANLT